MAFQPVPNTIKLAFNGVIDSQQIVNTMHVVKTTGAAVTAEEVFNVAQFGASLFTADVMTFMGNQYAFTNCTATDLSVPDGAQTVSTLNAGAVGGFFDGDPMPNNVAYCLTVQTGLSGRSRRGRFFVAALNRGMMLSTNTVDPNWRSDITGAVQRLFGEFFVETDEVFRAVVVSRFLDGSQRPVAITTPVSNVTARDAIIDSQRRRLPGRGA